MLRYRAYLVEKRAPLTVDRVAALRKEFLVLMKNVKKLLVLKDLEKIDMWRKAVIKWKDLFEEFLVQVREDLQNRVRMQAGKPEWEKPVNEKDVAYLLDAMQKAWSFASNLGPPGNSLAYYRDPRHKGWFTDDRIFGKFESEASKWERRVRRYAPKAWEWLKDVAVWTQRTGLSGGGGKPVALNLREVQNVSMEGFSVQVLGDSGDKNDRERIVRFRQGLKFFKKRAGKAFPAMLRRMPPIVLNLDSGRSQYAGTYHPDHIEVGIWGMLSGPAEIAHVIAHEICHCLWRALSGAAQKAWSEFVQGSTTTLDLRDVVKKGQWATSKKLAKEDPVRYIQLMALLHDPAYKHLDLLGPNRTQGYLDKGGNPIVRVTTRPITGYSAKNPEEAFCEACSLLVAFGPRTVLPEIRAVLRGLVPGLKTEGAMYEVDRMREVLAECS